MVNISSSSWFKGLNKGNIAHQRSPDTSLLFKTVKVAQDAEEGK